MLCWLRSTYWFDSRVYDDYFELCPAGYDSFLLLGEGCRKETIFLVTANFITLLLEVNIL